MMHYGNRSLLALLPAAMLATGLVSAPAQAQDGVIRIGITLRMIVENGLKYGQMAKDELEAVNASGGINGKKIEVILLDDECKPDKGIANVNRFIHQNKVHLVMGSTCSSVSLPMVDITAKEEVPQIVPHSTNTNITKKNSAWVFRTSVSERFYASVHAKYLVRERRQEGRLSVHQRRRRDRLREGLHGLHEEDLQRRSGLRSADAGDGSRFPRASAQDQVARRRTCWRSAASSMRSRASRSSPTRSASRRRCAAWRLPPPPTRRCLNSPATRSSACVYAAAFNCKDERPVAQDFVKMVHEKYKVRCPDHDFSQAYETAQIIKQALKNAKLDADRRLAQGRPRCDPRRARQHQELHRSRLRPDQLLRRCRRRSAATATGPASWSSTPRAARTSTRACWRACRSSPTSASKPPDLIADGSAARRCGGRQGSATSGINAPSRGWPSAVTADISQERRPAA